MNLFDAPVSALTKLGLTKWNVYRQCPPIELVKFDWRAHVQLVGQVLAKDSTHALREAQAAGFAVAPMVEQARGGDN